MSTAWREHVHGAIEPLPDNRPLDLFDLACAAACVAVTVATIAFIYANGGST